MALRPRAADPEPYTVPTTGQWDGADGSWSTFRIGVGTPAQDFRVLVSTRGHETWVPAPEGCTADDGADCAASRGAEPFNGAASPGFQSNRSETWDEIGLYNLGLEESLGYSGNGLYGYDTLRLASGQDPNALEMKHQAVAAIADKDYYMGVLGLSVTSSSFDTASEPVPSLLENLVNNKSIPSRSYAYTAGAPYRFKKVLGNLILGGYDQARFDEAPTFNFTFGSTDDTSLVVGVQSITTSNSLLGVAAMTVSGHLSLVDSTVPDLWLPQDACDHFETYFGLNYDSDTGLYLVNDTIHDQLLSLNPSLTIKLGNEIHTSDTNSTNIVLPYAAFDHSLSPSETYPNGTRYFPIRRAANDSQLVLGRTFLQEAYLVVDHDRRNFSIAQARFADPLPDPEIVTIWPPGDARGADPPNSGIGLSTGATAGIAVAAAVVGVFAIVALIFCWRRRRRHRRAAVVVDESAAAWDLQQQQPQYASHQELESKPYDPWAHAVESDNNEIAELAGGVAKQQHPSCSTPELGSGRDGAYELAGGEAVVVHEMDAGGKEEQQRRQRQ